MGRNSSRLRGQHAVEERGVAVLQRGEADVPLEVVRLAAEVLELEVDLLLDGQRPGPGRSPARPKACALVQAEGQVLVEQALAEQELGPRRSMLAGRPAAMASYGEGSARML